LDISVLLFSIFFILSFALIQPIGCHTNKIIIIINDVSGWTIPVLDVYLSTYTVNEKKTLSYCP